MGELLAGVTLFPQTLINVRLADGAGLEDQPGAWRPRRERAEAELGDAGRVLIRASGTEPLLRVMVEARDAAQAEACARRLVATVEAGSAA